MKFIYVATFTVLLGIAVGAPIPVKGEEKEAPQDTWPLAKRSSGGKKWLFADNPTSDPPTSDPPTSDPPTSAPTLDPPTLDLPEGSPTYTHAQSPDPYSLGGPSTPTNWRQISNHPRGGERSFRVKPYKMSVAPVDGNSTFLVMGQADGQLQPANVPEVKTRVQRQRLFQERAARLLDMQQKAVKRKADSAEVEPSEEQVEPPKEQVKPPEEQTQRSRKKRKT